MEAIPCDTSAPGSTSLVYFFPALDYLPIDSRSIAAGTADARVVSRALEVRVNSSRFSTVHFPDTVCIR